MNNPYAAQQRSQLNSASAEKAEGWALIETARRLEAAKNNPYDKDEVLTVVRLNWRIWTIIQASLVEPDCPLPRSVRENLLNLSKFIDRRSAELIGKPGDTHKLEVLVNINRQIGAGLMGNPGTPGDTASSDTETSQTPQPPASPDQNSEKKAQTETALFQSPHLPRSSTEV